jgi:hypothetical protein
VSLAMKDLQMIILCLLIGSALIWAERIVVAIGQKGACAVSLLTAWRDCYDRL